MKKNVLLKFMNFWPPYFGAGVRVKRISPDFREIDVHLKLHFWNQNYVGTQFGGSMFSMTDPFYMLMLLENLGSEYIVWDKAASIQYKKPGRGEVRCHFRLSEAQLDQFRKDLTEQPKIEPVLIAQILDEQNEVVAEVEKVLYIRRKDSIKKV